MQKLTSDDVDNPLAALVSMYKLEDNGEADLQSLDSNHIVIRQNHDYFIDPGYHVWQYFYRIVWRHVLLYEIWPELA